MIGKRVKYEILRESKRFKLIKSMCLYRYQYYNMVAFYDLKQEMRMHLPVYHGIAMIIRRDIKERVG
jgi:hypothetical protein